MAIFLPAGDSFIARYHHISPEGRCPVPTQFDATLGWALGHCAAALVQSRKTGYIACAGDLLSPPSMWSAYGVPMTALLSKPPPPPTAAAAPEKTSVASAASAASSGPSESVRSSATGPGGASPKRVLPKSSGMSFGPRSRARAEGSGGGLLDKKDARPGIEKRHVDLRTDPIYTTYKKVSQEQLWVRRLSYRQPGPTQFSIGMNAEALYSTCLDYSYTILAEYLSAEQLQKAVVSHNNSTLLADPDERIGTASRSAAWRQQRDLAQQRDSQQEGTSSSSSGLAAFSPKSQTGAPPGGSARLGAVAEADSPLAPGSPEPEYMKVHYRSQLSEGEGFDPSAAGVGSASPGSASPGSKDTAGSKGTRATDESATSSIGMKDALYTNNSIRNLHRPAPLGLSDIITDSDNIAVFGAESSGSLKSTPLATLEDPAAGSGLLATPSNAAQADTPTLTPAAAAHFRAFEGPEIQAWLPLNPPVIAPKRLLNRMSDVQRRRVQYQPKLPRYFNQLLYNSNSNNPGGSKSLGSMGKIQNYILEENENSAVPLSAELKFLRKLFPKTHRLKSVRLIPSQQAQQAQGADEAGGGSLNMTHGSLSGLGASSRGPGIIGGHGSQEALHTGSTAHQDRMRRAASVLGPKISTRRVLNIGVVFLGRESPGMHNAVWGLFDFLEGLNNGSTLYGFLGGGFGLLKKKYVEITREKLLPYCNQGGLDMLQRSDYSVTKSETKMQQVLDTCLSMNLDALIVAAGAPGHPDTALLAEYFYENNSVSSCARSEL